MKVEVKEGEKDRYPYLGANRHASGLFVLFSENCTGVVLCTPALSGWCVGHYANNWAEDHFTAFTGSVTLSN